MERRQINAHGRKLVVNDKKSDRRADSRFIRLQTRGYSRSSGGRVKWQSRRPNRRFRLNLTGGAGRIIGTEKVDSADPSSTFKLNLILANSSCPRSTVTGAVVFIISFLLYFRSIIASKVCYVKHYPQALFLEISLCTLDGLEFLVGQFKFGRVFLNRFREHAHMIARIQA